MARAGRRSALRSTGSCVATPLPGQVLRWHLRIMMASPAAISRRGREAEFVGAKEARPPTTIVASRPVADGRRRPCTAMAPAAQAVGDQRLVGLRQADFPTAEPAMLDRG